MARIVKMRNRPVTYWRHGGLGGGNASDFSPEEKGRDLPSGEGLFGHFISVRFTFGIGLLKGRSRWSLYAEVWK